MQATDGYAMLGFTYVCYAGKNAMHSMQHIVVHQLQARCL
jgi:hypothetical protein